MAKAAFWDISDTERRQRGEQTGLDTLVVHAKRCILAVGFATELGGLANAVSMPPGDYGRKVKTQRN